MSVTESLFAFTLAAALLAVMPGLDSALVLRTAAVEGRAQALRAALGVNAGCLLWGVAVAFGLGALFAVSELAYSALKVCGAFYLAWLGIKLLYQPRTSFEPLAAETSSNWFIRGLLGNVLNPKVGVFYLSFLPQFIPQGHSAMLWTFILVGIHIALSFIWALLLIGATAPLGRWLRRASVMRWLDRLTGCVFIVFAVKLVLSRR